MIKLRSGSLNGIICSMTEQIPELPVYAFVSLDPKAPAFEKSIVASSTAASHSEYNLEESF